MKWIGLTGGYGSGKSTAANYLRSLGITVIDADEMARLAVRPGSEALTKVVSRFGTDILKTDGTLDRARLAQKVFGQPAELVALESLIHPEVKRLTLERRREAEFRGEPLAVYDVPLLFEKNMFADFDKVIVVTADRETQIARAMARDGVTREQAEKRLQSQKPLDEKARQAHYVVDNNGDLASLKAAMDRVVAEINRL